jgi:GGDEF domain-containing protein
MRPEFPREHRELHRLPNFMDEQTGLFNRNWFEAELQSRINGCPGEFAVILVDLDDLKATNDASGHSAGDILLQNTALVLDSSIRRHDRRHRDERRARPEVPSDRFSLTVNDSHAVRLHGDEFVLLLNGRMKQDTVDAVMKRVQRNLAESGIRASMGGRPHRAGESREELLNDVDSLMYQDKQTRKAWRQQEQLRALPARKRAAYRLGSKLLNFSGMKPPVR